MAVTLSFCATAKNAASSGGSMLGGSDKNKYKDQANAQIKKAEESAEDRINRQLRELDADYKAGKIDKKSYNAKKAALLQQLFN